MNVAGSMGAEQVVLVNLSGRGDKDLGTIVGRAEGQGAQ